MNYFINNNILKIEQEDIEFVLPFFHAEKLILKNKEYVIEQIDPNPNVWVLTQDGKAFGARDS